MQKEKSAKAGQRRRVVLALAAVLVLLAGLAAGGYYLAYQNIRANGIVLQPGAVAEPVQAVAFLQNDPAWAEDYIGDSDYSMAGAGCLISCVAGVLCQLGVETDPGALNRNLSAADGFAGGDLLWYKLEELYPQVAYHYKRLFSARDIDRDLVAGRLPMVKVKYKGNGAQHWLLVVGATEADYLVLDPLNADRQPIPLATHGRVYAYRMLQSRQ